MIRVFLLAVLGLGALVMIAHKFPAAPEPPAAEGVESHGAPFARWDGAWEGTFRTYDPDGTTVSVLQVRQEYDSASAEEQRVVITDRYDDGRTEVSRGENLVVNGSLVCRVTKGDGVTVLHAGRKVGHAIVWHRLDEASALEETFREEIVRTPAGDLYTIDGAGTYGTGAKKRTLLFEGRYHRVERVEE